MKVLEINNLNNTSFGQKRYLDKKTYGYLKELLPQINKQTVYVSNDTNYKSSFLKKLKVDDFTLIDGRGFIKQVPQSEQLQKETLLEMGKTHLVIKNKDGEILAVNKSPFLSWNKLLGKVSNYMKLISENFENTTLIKRIRLNSDGYTAKGIIKRNNLEDEFERLEEKMLNTK